MHHGTVAIVYGVTSGRAQSLVVLAVALISIVIGARALARRHRMAAIVAVIGGLSAAVVAVVHVAYAGAIGTGSGKLGAIAAIVVASIATILGGLGLVRTRSAS
jgi:hypothetical protein